MRGEISCWCDSARVCKRLLNILKCCLKPKVIGKVGILGLPNRLIPLAVSEPGTCNLLFLKLLSVLIICDFVLPFNVLLLYAFCCYFVC